MNKRFLACDIYSLSRSEFRTILRNYHNFKFMIPIRDLSKKITLVDEGDLIVDLSIRSHDEIGQLSNSFNIRLEELRLKATIKEIFGKYVDPRVVEKIISGDEPSENNEYLDIIGSPLSANQGVLDRFIGTVVMDFWGEPFTDQDEHAGLALKTAGDLISSMSQVEEVLSRHLGGIHSKQKNVLTIGVSTGEMIVGNMGSPSSMSFTVMADVVNNASRLKGASNLVSHFFALRKQY